VKFEPNGKSWSIWKEHKGFSVYPKWAKRFFRTQKNFFRYKNAMKVQQRRPKTEERRAFENLLAHFRCAENPSVHSKFQK
jgi:hypothetical protein